MDYAKLTHLNGSLLRQADDERLTREVLERLAHRTELALGATAAAAHPRADARAEGARQDAGGTR